MGGARFLSGLIRRTDPRQLTVIGNTGDDEEFFGLHVAPDLDTVVYTLAGVAPRRRGWGLAGDAFTCLAALGGLGFPTWFRLGDRDLATHLARTAWLRAGWSLSRVTAALARAHGVRGRAHERVGHHGAHPERLDARRPGAIDVVEHQEADEAAVEAGDAGG